jgi:hypothetical protein
MSKKCKLGKSCGATCVSQQDKCVLELGSKVSKSLSQAVSTIDRIQGKLDETVQLDKPMTTEEQAVQYVKDSYKSWLTGGMENRFYGGPGQRGEPNSKFWLLGQEAYAEDKYNPKAKENDPVALVNSMRLHNKLYAVARKETQDKQSVTTGVESFLAKRPFTLDTDTTVEKWAKASGSSYYGRLGKFAKELGYSGEVLGANVSSFLQPSGQKGFSAVSAMLKRNGVNVKTFANGAFRNLETWQRASAEARLPLMIKGIKRYRPDVVYLGQQSPTDKKTFSNMVLYSMAKKLDLPVYHAKLDGNDYKYVLVPKAGGGQTVILNGWHPTGHFSGGRGAFIRQFDFAKNLTSSLRETGLPPKNVNVEKINKTVIDAVLGEVS